MKSVLGVAAVTIVGIYLAATLQHGGQAVAMDHLMWVLGAIILGTSLGLVLFDP